MNRHLETMLNALKVPFMLRGRLAVAPLAMESSLVFSRILNGESRAMHFEMIFGIVFISC